MKSTFKIDDKENIRLAKEQGFNYREYVEILNKPELVDRIAVKEEENKANIEINEKQLTDVTRKNKHIIFSRAEKK